MPGDQKVRIDKYLWAIRIFKTRTQAAAACDNGKVKYDGAAAKASRHVAVGDEYAIKTADKKWLIKVTALLDRRLKYSEAINYYVDLTPEEDKEFNQRMASSFYTGKRMSKQGRPTKKQRRDLDDFTSP